MRVAPALHAFPVGDPSHRYVLLMELAGMMDLAPSEVLSRYGLLNPLALQSKLTVVFATEGWRQGKEVIPDTDVSVEAYELQVLVEHCQKWEAPEMQLWNMFVPQPFSDEVLKQFHKGVRRARLKRLPMSVAAAKAAKKEHPEWLRVWTLEEEPEACAVTLLTLSEKAKV